MNIPQQPHFSASRVPKSELAPVGSERCEKATETASADEPASSLSLPRDLETEISADDIQEAYLKALQVMEEIEGQPSEDDFVDEAAADESNAEASTVSSAPPDASDGSVPVTGSPEGTGVTDTHSDAEPQTQVPSAVELDTNGATSTASKSTAKDDPKEPRPMPSLTPAQIIEAILFVGGNPITSKRLCNVLGGSTDYQFVEQRIDELNANYAAQGRPYEIRLGDGGYRLSLRPEFEAVRNKVHGAGPREVRLSQDALEILALVAYQQPISPEDVEASGKKNAGNLVRQLIRRELVAIHRVDATRTGIRYQTTPRFLSLFGLASLDELPQADELNMR